MELGHFGVWTSSRAIGDENGSEAARLAERLGYGAFWLGGSPRLTSLRPLLEATEHLVLATGIINIWAYEPSQLAAEYAELVKDYPDRLLVGIGVGHPEATSSYTQPLETMRGFLDVLDDAQPPLPREHRCLAALAPGMLALAARRTLGAAPYFVPLAHTSATRASLGNGPLLAPELAFVLDQDNQRARARARDYASTYLRLTNYTRNLLRHGFDEDDLADGGSDRLIDAIIPHGDAAAIASRHEPTSTPAPTTSPSRRSVKPASPSGAGPPLARRSSPRRCASFLMCAPHASHHRTAACGQPAQTKSARFWRSRYGALMEPSGRNRWQEFRYVEAVKPA